MKFLLSIILWAIVPMLTPQGLQIGVVNIKNKTIRIMKMNLNNPAFLQSAGNVKNDPEIRMVLSGTTQTFPMSANGSIVIESVRNGEIVRETYSDLSDTNVTITTDEGTEVVIYGAVTKLQTWFPYPHNQLISLDVSKNTALTYLDCNNCTGLTALDVSKNTALTYLNCSGDTGLTALDVSKNTALIELYCSDTGLTALDVSKNTALTSLNCNGNTGMTALDVSKNTALTSLNCNGNTGMTALDVSKNIALTYLNCNNCTGLIALDVSKNTALTYLDCNNCTGLTALDVSKNTALTYLDCNNCTGLTALDVSKNTALTELNCSYTGLMSLDIQNTAILESGNLFENISTNLTILQVAGTSAWAYGEVENWLNGDAPNDGTILVDDNTPQEVITAATAKNWTVEYVDAV